MGILVDKRRVRCNSCCHFIRSARILGFYPLVACTPLLLFPCLVSCSRNYRLNAFALSVLFDIFIRWPAHLAEVADTDDDAAPIDHYCIKD